MIDRFITIWDAHKDELEAKYRQEFPSSYTGIMNDLVALLAKYDDAWGRLDPERIHTVDDGNYQGTLLFIIAEEGYQPSTYYTCKVNYGSCSGCDTFEAIRGYTYDQSPTAEQVHDFMQLALHMLQSIKEV